MPSFKPKSNKKIKFNKKSTITLDTKHREFINEFSKDETNTIPELEIVICDVINVFSIDIFCKIKKDKF